MNGEVESLVKVDLNLSELGPSNVGKWLKVRGRFSSQQPSLLVLEQAGEVEAGVDDGVGRVVGLQDVIGSRERHAIQFDLQVAIVSVGVRRPGETSGVESGLEVTGLPKLMRVVDGNSTIIRGFIAGGDAGSSFRLLSRFVVSALIPEAGVSLEVEVLDDTVLGACTKADAVGKVCLDLLEDRVTDREKVGNAIG